MSGCPLQVEEQKFEMDRLRRELEEKIAEVTRIKATLQSSERVSEHHPRPHSLLHFLSLSFFLPYSVSYSLAPCQTSEQASSSMKALQAEKERLMRSVSEREAELSSLRQTSQAHQSSLQQAQERNSRELGELQGKLQEKVSGEDKGGWGARAAAIATP